MTPIAGHLVTMLCDPEAAGRPGFAVTQRPAGAELDPVRLAPNRQLATRFLLNGVWGWGAREPFAASPLGRFATGTANP